MAMVSGCAIETPKKWRGPGVSVLISNKVFEGSLRFMRIQDQRPAGLEVLGAV
jgi:hypothetical protein